MALSLLVGVGIMVAHDPLHGSQRAGLPHWGLASGDDAHTTQGIGMTHAGGRQPVSHQTVHSFPRNRARLTAPRQGTVPEPGHPEAEHAQQSVILGNPVISKMSPDSIPKILSESSAVAPTSISASTSGQRSWPSRSVRHTRRPRSAWTRI